MGRTSGTKDLPQPTRLKIANHLSMMSVNGRLPFGAMTTTASLFGCDRTTVSRIWGSREQVLNPPSGPPSRHGPKPTYSAEQLQLLISLVPFDLRGSLRALAGARGVSKSTLGRAVKEKKSVRAASVVLKPYLSDAHHKARLEFALLFVRLARGSLFFGPMYDRVHIDEKWFFIDKATRRVYLAADEDVPHRTTINKRFITKVTFLVAVARPRHEHHRKQLFDGKVGLWPVVETHMSKRSSKNRPANVAYTASIEMNKKVYKRMLLVHVIPAVKAFWPGERRVIIQHDNATPHGGATDKEVAASCTEGGWDNAFEKQPPRSPDMNVLDLGFFGSIQAAQHTRWHRRPLEVVHEAFVSLQLSTLDKCFLTMQAVLERCMVDKGVNSYRLPHIGKDKLVAEGNLPITLPCDEAHATAVHALEYEANI